MPTGDTLKEHDYIKTQDDKEMELETPELLEIISELNKKVEDLEQENEQLKKKCITLDQIKASEEDCQYWTGFPNYGTFKALFDYLENAASTKRVWRGQETFSKDNFTNRYSSKPGPSSYLSLEEEFFMVMVRLKVGLMGKDLGQRFGLSPSAVSKIFASWINLMYVELKVLCEMPDCTSEKAKQFKGFPLLRIILDCTEIFTQKPSSLKANREVYSNYKSHSTFKYLVGISPHPAVVFVSRAWGGRASDKFITSNCPELIEALNPGEQVMVDRGFSIESILTPKDVQLVIPDFKGKGRSQLSKSEGTHSERIAEARIHVERAMQRIKTYHILDNEFKLSMSHLADQIFVVCAYLVNFQSPFIK